MMTIGIRRPVQIMHELVHGTIGYSFSDEKDSMEVKYSELGLEL